MASATSVTLEKDFEREFAEARRLLVVLRQSVAVGAASERARITAQLDGLVATAAALRARLPAVSASRRELCAAKLEQLERDQHALSSALQQQHVQREADESEAKRDEAAVRRWQGEQGVVGELAQAAQLRSGVVRARQAAEEVLALSENVKHELREQNSVLERTVHKVSDVLEQLGVSRSLLRAIARRQWVDAMFVYAGMAALTLLLLLVWWYR